MPSTQTLEHPPAHWEEQIERLKADLHEAVEALATARQGAAMALLAGGEDTSREIALRRDRIDAIKSAIGEAERRLADATAAVTAQRQADERGKAREVARKRHQAAQELDVAFAQAETAWLRFLGLGTAYRQHQLNAGDRAMSLEKLTSGEALRGALIEAAPSLARSLHIPRAVQPARLPLASWAAQQTPWKGTKT